MRLDLWIQLWGELMRASDDYEQTWLTQLRYATGWNYFLKYAIVLPNNLTAAGIIIQYWRPDLNVAIFVTAFTVAIIAVNVSYTPIGRKLSTPPKLTRCRSCTYLSSAKQNSGCRPSSSLSSSCSS